MNVLNILMISLGGFFLLITIFAPTSFWRKMYSFLLAFVLVALLLTGILLIPSGFSIEDLLSVISEKWRFLLFAYSFTSFTFLVSDKVHNVLVQKKE